MTLYINTTQNDFIEIGLKDKSKLIVVKKFKSHRTQAEKLLLAIEKLLKVHKLKLSDLAGLEVENRGGSFTSLRIGVVTANALGYALGIKVAGNQKSKKSVEFKSGSRVKPGMTAIIEPIYGREPDITAKKRPANA